jgi:hypothetical protein
MIPKNKQPSLREEAVLIRLYSSKKAKYDRQLSQVQHRCLVHLADSLYQLDGTQNVGSGEVNPPAINLSPSQHDLQPEQPTTLLRQSGWHEIYRAVYIIFLEWHST